MPTSNSLDYINSTDYDILKDRIKDLVGVQEELVDKRKACRKLRYTEVDVELEREASNIAPDALFIPQHIIDSNIRTEQPGYIQYITQAQRAVVLQNQDDPAQDTQVLEKDVTTRLRYPGWNLAEFANIDGMQMFGYSTMEIVPDLTCPGHVACEALEYGDFAMIMDTRDVQEAEMVIRAYYYTRTKLVQLCDPAVNEFPWNKEEVDKLLGSETGSSTNNTPHSNSQEYSLYKVLKCLFRVKGIVQVAWAAYDQANDWLRDPKPLLLGRRKMLQPQEVPGVIQSAVQQLQDPLLAPQTKKKKLQNQISMLQNPQIPPSVEEPETEYPYIMYQYLISEDKAYDHLKGRVYLDQDTQDAVTSLMSSTCTQSRRASYLMGSKDTSDPNDDMLIQKNGVFGDGKVVNGKITQFKLDGVDPSIFQSIQMLATANKSETSQVNWAVNNRKDSRKTAREVEASGQQQQALSTVQVVLYSTATQQKYAKMFAIVQSRVLAGLIQVNQAVKPFYSAKYIVKPAGDTDVIEREQLKQTMMNSWPVMQNTPAAQAYLCDLITLLFPNTAPKYIQIFQQAQQQQMSQQNQQMQQMLAVAKQTAQGIIELSKHKDWFSEVGQLHAFPIVQQAAMRFENLMQSQQQQGKPQQQ